MEINNRVFTASVAIVSCLISTVFCQQGNFCTLEGQSTSGQCIIISSCPVAVEGFRKGIRPQICGFQGAIPLVCCPTSGISPVKPTRVDITTPTTTTSTTTTRPIGTESVTKRPRNQYQPGELSLEKCEDYKKYSYVWERAPVGFDNNRVQVQRCSFKGNPVVIGGENADPREFPHMAALGYKDGKSKKWACGGSLISESYVLTAAHCLSNQEYGNPIVVRLGERNIASSSDDAFVQEINIIGTIPHPEYKSPSRYNDIALLRLEHAVTPNLDVRPACLHTSLNFKGGVIAIGWGNTEDGGEQSDILQKVPLQLFDVQRCNKTFRGQSSLQNGIMDNLQICAGSFSEEKDTCQGDSGSPLQKLSKVSCMYDVVGLTSFGLGCGNVGIPGVYTRVVAYVEWIEGIVWP